MRVWRILAILLAMPVAVGLAVAAGAGGVTGRAYQEPARPTAAEVPVAGIEVVVVPRSEAFRARLEFIKAHARDSLNSYVAAAGEIQDAREAYERELRADGRAEAVFKTAVKPDGTFSVAGVPPGQWTVIGVKSVEVRRDRSVNRKLDRDARTFVQVPRLKAVHDLTVWLHDVTVVPGEAVAVEFTDRNLWFAGVLEERVTLRPAPPKTGSSRR
jgi:hypothetical protein